MAVIRDTRSGILAPASYWMGEVLEWFKPGGIGSQLGEINRELSCGGWSDLSKRFALIRKGYELIKDEDYDPYPFYVSLTPIESHLWQDIRQWPGQVRMYPQYPVGKYFVDFGDPWKRVAIEADGKQWHDAEKDRIRDAALEDMGWTVYHVQGCDTIKEGVIDDILDFHYPKWSKNAERYPQAGRA